MKAGRAMQDSDKALRDLAGSSARLRGRRGGRTGYRNRDCGAAMLRFTCAVGASCQSLSPDSLAFCQTASNSAADRGFLSSARSLPPSSVTWRSWSVLTSFDASGCFRGSGGMQFHVIPMTIRITQDHQPF